MSYRLIHKAWNGEDEILTLTDLEGNVIEDDMDYADAARFFTEDDDER